MSIEPTKRPRTETPPAPPPTKPVPPPAQDTPTQGPGAPAPTTPPPAGDPTPAPGVPTEKPAPDVTPERKAEIDKYVTENAGKRESSWIFWKDEKGGEAIGDALTGKSPLGKMTPAEQAYMSQQAVNAWGAQDPGQMRENIKEASERVKNDPQARAALATAMAAPALSDDDAVRRVGAILTTSEISQRNHELFQAAAKLDLGAVIKSYEGNETGLAQRIASADEPTRKAMWDALGDPGRMPQEQQQKMTALLFFSDQKAKDAGPEYRQSMANAIALARRPGGTPQDKLARQTIASNLTAVMNTDKGRDMLLNPENTAGSRLWAMNEIANQTGCINAASFAGFDAAALKDRPGNPGTGKPPSGDKPDEGEVMADMAQMALDLTGLVDPTPISDGANTLVSLFRGDVGGALISAAGMLPYAGDLAKVGKLGKWAKTIDNAVELAARDSKFLEKAKPALETIRGAINKIPESVMNALPESAQKTLRGIAKKIDDALGAAARRAPLVVDDAVGSSARVNGRDVTVGELPTVNTRPDGKLEVTTVDGRTVKVNEPQKYDTRVENPDGSVTYTKKGHTMTYDKNGFPQFDSKADIYLDPKHINSKNEAEHFREANEQVAKALENDPSLADRMGLTPEQVQFFKDGKNFNQSPPDLTWNHHQDAGKMELVDREIHSTFPHTGGMAIWGGGRS
ncbi:HNH endonuclease [Paracoccus sulfuroxidans]|uniref:Colicin-lik bacteriocin with DNase/tRNase domain n=1 Tax=Paracoccus sulfuroxidans TaxID=384678 RepID=A0A562NU39_9RHOB|nr:HNH endonuclease [Paracoccus sulfuroxidans]TWI35675.1 colicin-lik bacteriocin with DNase/tRNase domain [Paracoccus sulfuroxidans]